MEDGEHPAGSNGAPPPSTEIGELTPPGAALLGPFSGPKVREASLVLRSMGVQHFVEPARLGSYIVVFERDKRRAKESLERYDEENRNWPPPKKRDAATYRGMPIVALAFAALAFFAWVTGPEKYNSVWFQKGASVAEFVMHGHPELSVTALTLHADAGHVFGNVLSGAIFGHLVERRMGPGLAMLTIVASGALGNFANAAYYFARGEPHASIGASTAVMAAVGILAATQALVFRSQASAKKRTIYDWATPIAGGLALLGTLGSGAESDLGAHGFGFLGGLVVGALLFLLFGRKRASAVWQSILGFASAAIVVGAWAIALRR
jgi:rhomboid protease GluP